MLFLEHKKTYRAVTGEVPAGDHRVPIGRADVKRQGTDLTVVTYGYELHRCLEAADRLAESEGIETEIVDVRSLAPLDTETILASVRSTARAMVVYEDNRTYGAGAEIAATIAEEAMFDLDAPIVRIGGPDIPAMPYAAPLEHVFTEPDPGPPVQGDARARALLRRFQSLRSRSDIWSDVRETRLEAALPPAGRAAATCLSSWRPPACCSCSAPHRRRRASPRPDGERRRRRSACSSPRLVLLAIAVLGIRTAVGTRCRRRPLASRRRRLHALITESPAVSYSWVPDEDRYLYVSPQIEQLFGVTPRDHMEDWAAQIVPEDRDRVVAASDAADRDRTPCTIEYRIVRPDGTVRWIHDESHFHQPDADGRPTVAQGVLYDITERKEAESRAIAAEERYRTLVERVPPSRTRGTPPSHRARHRPTTSARRSKPCSA